MIKKINDRSFKRYGWVIGFPCKGSCGKKKNLFRVVLKETQKTGWRIAYLVVRDRVIDKLEQHPGSYESFEPVKGKSLLFVSSCRISDRIETFLLDRPVILRKNIWHGVVAKGFESEIKITENAQVKCVYWDLGRPHFPL
jgi:hypothetical protein